MNISGVLVRLTVGGTRHLLLDLDSEGAIRRGGRRPGPILAGWIPPDFFEDIRRQITPELLRWNGQSWTDPFPAGKRCHLTLVFRHDDGHETRLRWEYGSESQEPPAEVRRFVLAAVEATNPWYQRQLESSRAHQEWHLVPLASSS